MAKKLSRFMAGLGQKVKGTFCNIIIENVAGSFFFFIPVKAKRIILKALIILNKVIMARSFYKKVI